MRRGAVLVSGSTETSDKTVIVEDDTITEVYELHLDFLGLDTDSYPVKDIEKNMGKVRERQSRLSKFNFERDAHIRELLTAIQYSSSPPVDRKIKDTALIIQKMNETRVERLNGTYKRPTPDSDVVSGSESVTSTAEEGDSSKRQKTTGIKLKLGKKGASSSSV